VRQIDPDSQLERPITGDTDARPRIIEVNIGSGRRAELTHEPAKPRQLVNCREEIARFEQGVVAKAGNP